LHQFFPQLHHPVLYPCSPRVLFSLLLAGNLETVFCRYCSNSNKLETSCLWMGGIGS
jgi:hypothetical protein